ncbi:hypothetical protein VTN00DRAFT_6605 [Thermoascus crustaceus]|uniref:uncharacterized protein n=1 Tax=Thermoascus crustaceus TaxID=5088 RepID=UPI003742D4C5
MPSSSLLLSVGSLALSSLLSPVAASPYQLVESFEGSHFFDNFDFFTGPDPTHGYVQYVDQGTAQSSGLVKINPSGSVYMGVDSQTTLDPNGVGRSSVRIESKKTYTKGLFIADIQHMPDSVCGVWPAFWTVGHNWPSGGEIDIIEGINQNIQNQMVLHTSGQCTINNSGMTGSVLSDNCQIAHSTTGCSVQGTDGSLGSPFNEAQGGVYAMEWTDQFIRIWFFPRSSIPQSIKDGNPDPATFGPPMGNFEGSCDIGNEFQEQKFIFDTTFCGDWAGGVYGSSGCPMSNPSNALESCTNYVALNPTAYKNAYWEINSVRIYQQGAAPPASSSAAVSSTSVAAPVRTSSSAPSYNSSISIGQPATASAGTAPAPAASSSPAAADTVIPECSEAETITPTPAPATTDPSAAKETVTSVIVTSYVDICPTGFTTSTVTQTVTYCPADVTPGAAPPGFSTTVTVCTACAATPTTVTLTLPTAQPSAGPSQGAVPAAATAAGASATFVTVPKPAPSGAAPVDPAGSPVASPVTTAVSGYSPAVASSSAPKVPAGPGSSSPYSYSGNGTSGSSAGPAPSVVVARPSTTRSSGPASSTTNPAAAPLFTGGAGKLSAGLTGLAGVFGLAMLL